MTIDRRVFLKSGGVGLGVLALTAVLGGTDVEQAFATSSDNCSQPVLPDPAVIPVPNPPYSKTLTKAELQHLETFDELDFVVFTNQEWSRFGESHASDIRVHWPDGHYTDGLTQHIGDIQWFFSWAPDTHIDSHPLRVAKDNLTAVTGVVAGTFTQPMPDGKGGYIPPTGNPFSVDMATVGIWNCEGVMSEEFLFFDYKTFYSEIGLA